MGSEYLSKGTRFADGFVIVDRVGEGTSAVVYRASSERYATVALKVWKGSEFQSETQIDRFRSEADLNRRLSHPHVARIFESGRDESGIYLVMEYLSGRTLAEHLASSGPVGHEEFLEIARALCRALSHVHAAGIVHGDIKPSNLMFASDGRLKLTDFGAARDRTGDTTLGVVRGTPNYVAPEQFLGQGATPASDLFSAAVVLYESLTGVRPFQGMTPAQRCTAPPPDPRTLAPSTPEGIARAIVAALSPDAAQRPRSALSLLALFDAEEHGQPGPAAAAPPPRPAAAVALPPPSPRSAPPRTVQWLAKPEPAVPRDVVPVFLALVRRLAQLEAAGEVHDPVTPQTVRLRNDNTPEISSHVRLDVTDSSVVPTARYGAPEVLRAGPPRSGAARISATLYSTGLVLYEILAGSTLFAREFEAVLAKRSELAWLEWQWDPSGKPSAIDKVVPGTPAELARIVSKMIEKDPAQRPQTYEEVERVLQRLMAAVQPTEEFELPAIGASLAPPAAAAAAAGRPWWKNPVLAGGGVSVLILVVLFVLARMLSAR